jgi:hypothetical protein
MDVTVPTPAPDASLTFAPAAKSASVTAPAVADAVDEVVASGWEGCGAGVVVGGCVVEGWVIDGCVVVVGCVVDGGVVVGGCVVEGWVVDGCVVDGGCVVGGWAMPAVAGRRTEAPASKSFRIGIFPLLSVHRRWSSCVQVEGQSGRNVKFTGQGDPQFPWLSARA